MKCAEEGCWRDRAKHRTRCNVCQVRIYRAKDPIKHKFLRLKSHAKERGKEFHLTLEEFREFCELTSYHELCGQKKDHATIDRIRDEEGYHKDNIQILTRKENIEKERARQRQVNSSKNNAPF